MNAHVYEGSRCIFCGVNSDDQTVYGETPCVDRQPLIHTSETPRVEP